MKPTNIIIAGVGGQGVMTLTQALTTLCERNDILVQSSVHKGGAQQLGSIHSVLRLFLHANLDARNYSTQLLDGDLDLILSLEPWETLRYSRYFSQETKVISNSRVIGIETERYQTKKFTDPCLQLQNLKVQLTLEDFSAEAEQRFGTKKMANFVVAQRAVLDKLIPFKNEDLVAAFQSLGHQILEIDYTDQIQNFKIEGERNV